MTMITINLSGVTAHVPGPKFAPRWEPTAAGLISQGNYDVIAVAPGEWFLCEEHEAIGLLKRFGGERKEPNDE
jgi:sarcosine oxidase gamma subunit